MIAVASATIFWLIGPISVPPFIGWLQAANEPTPKNQCDSVPPNRRPKNSPVVLLGDSAFIPSSGATYSALQLGACMGLQIHHAQDGTAISTNLYSRQGELIGRLRDNGYSVVGDHKLIVERSGDLSTLVVHDGQGTELLYVRILNPIAIQIRGVFTCPIPRLRTVVITNNEMILPGYNTFGSNCSVGGRAGIKVGP
ncbi:hypothetical protein [Methylovirgula sp. HY1]|uniref:hypothetical protein n=1 Tax=Methylovirgula sp. HY1 TaxID=2822761 RepID=UPI001C5AAA87|nr:hypothetical protein [Methylovirgula sp. HY1]